MFAKSVIYVKLRYVRYLSYVRLILLQIIGQSIPKIKIQYLLQRKYHRKAGK